MSFSRYPGYTVYPFTLQHSILASRYYGFINDTVSNPIGVSKAASATISCQKTPFHDYSYVYNLQCCWCKLKLEKCNSRLNIQQPYAGARLVRCSYFTLRWLLTSF
eukprot:675130-Rhodomonas_salina.1